MTNNMFDPSKLNLDFDNLEAEKTLKEKAAEEKVAQEIKTGKVLDSASPEKNSQPPVVDIPPVNDILAETNILEEEEKTSAEKDAETEVQKTSEEILVSEPAVEEAKPQKSEAQKRIIDINIKSLGDLLAILTKHDYDFFIIEPDKQDVKISFRRDGIEKEKRFIHFPTYSEIILKIKTLTKLNLQETKIEQKGQGEISIKNFYYKVTSKIVPSGFGEKAFLKLKRIEKKANPKKGKKVGMAQILSFLGFFGVLALILLGAFVAFVVSNAKTVEDVKFFNSLGVNLADINLFLSNLISIVFGILLFIETTAFLVFGTKAFLAKKGEKRKRIVMGVIAGVFLVLTFVSGTLWMVMDQKVKNLPEWQNIANGDIQVFDNSRLISEKFKTEGARVADTSNLIGPITLKYDVSVLAEKEQKNGTKINKYIWDFGDGTSEETLNPVIIHDFNEKGNYDISLTLQETSPDGSFVEKEVEGFDAVSIGNIVTVVEKEVRGGGKRVEFDASDIEQLGKIEWYIEDNLETPIWEGSIFKPEKIIFDEEIFALYIRRDNKEEKNFDKVFIISGEEANNLGGNILYTRSLDNDLEFSFQLSDIVNDFGDGFIERVTWVFGDKENTIELNIRDIENSSKISHVFETYGDKTIQAVITNGAGKTKTLTQTVNIPKTLKLKSGLRFFEENAKLEEVTYQKNVGEYYIDNLGAPTFIKIDARLLRAESARHTLQDVHWDIDGDGDRDATGKTLEYEVATAGNHKIEAKYIFQHRTNQEEQIIVTETILIEAAKKDAVLRLVIDPQDQYAPTVVRFDASRSQIKDEDIAKFIFDYGDGTPPEERGAINPGHKYTKSGTYTVTLTVVSMTGKEFSLEKTLILREPEQQAEASVSLKQAPVYQEIDFSSSKSQGQVQSYFWDFGDGNVSTQANPQHQYDAAGTYTATLKIDFSNGNVDSDSITIEVIE